MNANPAGTSHCVKCGFSACATGYEILGQEDPLSKPASESSQALMERFARGFHVVMGCLFLGVMGWALFIAPIFNPWVFWGALVLGTLAIGVGIFGSRKAIFQLFSIGWI